MTTDSLTSVNLIVSLTDPDENLNQPAKDVMDFRTRAYYYLVLRNWVVLVQIEAIDQTNGSRLTGVIAQNIMLVETGNKYGVFTANGIVFGSSTLNAISNKGNITMGSSTTPCLYPNRDHACNLTTGPGVKFQYLKRLPQEGLLLLR